VIILLFFFSRSGFGSKKSIFFALLNRLYILLGLSLLAAKFILFGLLNLFDRFSLSCFGFFYFRLDSYLLPLFRLLHFNMSELSLN
jgi:hypothetical protein